MQLNEKFAKLLIYASNRYASQRNTRCTIEECAFEETLLSLFVEARAKGVDLQDMVVITSAVLAVALTRPDRFALPNDKLKLVKM